MCDICLPDGSMSSCPFCGKLICFDEYGNDDVSARAAVAPSGDVGCERCVVRIIVAEEHAALDEENAEYYMEEDCAE